MGTVTGQQLSSQSNLGWSKQKNVWVTKWTELSALSGYCQEAQSCGYKSQMTANATVQAFHARQCVHAIVKKTDKSFDCDRFCFRV